MSNKFNQDDRNFAVDFIKLHPKQSLPQILTKLATDNKKYHGLKLDTLKKWKNRYGVDIVRQHHNRHTTVADDSNKNNLKV